MLSATCAITSVLLALNLPRLGRSAGELLPAPSLSAGVRSTRRERNAGTRPKSIPVARDANVVKASTRRSISAENPMGRSDVLVYSTPPLTQALEVTGPVKVVLYASSSTPDTDFAAKLVDVAPNGYAANLCDGLIRARYRNSPAHPELMQPDEVYEFTIDLHGTGNVFLPGHQIRLEIASSNFPKFDRNPNTSEPAAMARRTRPAVQTVFHDSQHASHVVLPVIPAKNS